MDTVPYTPQNATISFKPLPWLVRINQIEGRLAQLAGNLGHAVECAALEWELKEIENSTEYTEITRPGLVDYTSSPEPEYEFAG